ncbi:MAG: AAA family ATPase [Candidatus Omnitrophota bacterium]
MVINMYLEFYGLKETPFNVTPDPSFLFFSKKHKEAFDYFIYGINERKGFLEITGEIGSGKTTLCRALLNHFEHKNPPVKTAYILNPVLSGVQLLRSIIEEFGLIPARKDKIGLICQLNKFLLEQLSLGHNAILIIDEAQNLKAAHLEEIRMLSNLETDKQKLFQIILVGQPELREKLKSPNLAQLKQRITVRFHLSPLDINETKNYIHHRLNIAGVDNKVIFTDSSIEEVYSYSKGVPRMINAVCDRALLLGYVLETQNINPEIIRRSINELEGILYEHNC